MGYIISETTYSKNLLRPRANRRRFGEFKRFALNIWSSESESPAIEIERWDSCYREDLATHPDPRRLRKETLEELRVVSVLVASTWLRARHFGSRVVVPSSENDRKVAHSEFFWCPADNIAGRVKRDRVPYTSGENKGSSRPRRAVS